MCNMLEIVIDGTESEQATQVESLLFHISALRAATANFSEENKLGEGGFGAVYKVQFDMLNSLHVYPLVPFFLLIMRYCTGSAPRRTRNRSEKAAELRARTWRA